MRLYVFVVFHCSLRAYGVRFKPLLVEHNAVSFLIPGVIQLSIIALKIVSIHHLQRTRVHVVNILPTTHRSYASWDTNLDLAVAPPAFNNHFNSTGPRTRGVYVI